MVRNKKKKRNENYFWLAVVFFAVTLIFSSIIKTIELQEAERFTDVEQELKEEAKVISDELTDHGEVSFAAGDVIDEDRFEEVSELPYQELRRKVNAQNDFCVYFEDEFGNLIEIEEGVDSFGSKDIFVNGEPCGR